MSKDTRSRLKSGRDKRAAPRYALDVPVECTCVGRVHKGRVQDISALGARLEKVGIQPAEGTVLGLKIALFENAVPMKLEGKVVRHTDSGGFSVQFVSLDARVERILRTLLPKLAGAPITEDGKAVASGKFQVDIGGDLHEQIAELAREQGQETIDWVVDQIEKSASDAIKERNDAKNRVRTKRS
jgi:predicted HicB family RNase H-like nuclease